MMEATKQMQLHKNLIGRIVSAYKNASVQIQNAKKNSFSSFAGTRRNSSMLASTSSAADPS